MSKWITMLVCLVLMVLPVHAQESDVQTVISNDETFSLQVPADWYVVDMGTGIIATSSEAAFGNILQNNAPQPGDILVLAFGQAMLESEVGAVDGDDLRTQAEKVAASLGEGNPPLVFGELIETPLPDGRPAVFGETTAESSQYGGFFLIDAGDGTTLGLVVLGLEETLDNSSDVLLSILASLTLGTPAPLNTASLVWSVEDVYTNLFNDLALVGEVIYTSDGNEGVLKFSLEGESLGKLEVADDLYRGASDIAADSQGNLWIADGFNPRVLKVTPEGEVLAVIEGGDKFDGLNPNNLAVGADDTLYMTVRRDEANILLRWSPEGEFLSEVDITIPDGVVWAMSAAPDGNIYVVDFAVGIRVFDATGTLINDNFARSVTSFSLIGGFAALADGTFLLTKSFLDSDEGYDIMHLNAEGTVIGKYSAEDLGFGGFESPSDFVMTPEGDVIVSDSSAQGSRLFRMTIVPPVGE